MNIKGLSDKASRPAETRIIFNFPNLHFPDICILQHSIIMTTVHINIVRAIYISLCLRITRMHARMENLLWEQTCACHAYWYIHIYRQLNEVQRVERNDSHATIVCFLIQSVGKNSGVIKIKL